MPPHRATMRPARRESTSRSPTWAASINSSVLPPTRALSASSSLDPSPSTPVRTGIHEGRCDERIAQGPIAAAPPADDGPRVREAGAGRRRRQSDLLPVLAPPDRAGAGHSGHQRGRRADQGRRVPGGEGLRYLRLQRDPATLQAEDPGVGAVRVDRAEVELLPGGEPWNWEDSYFNRIGPGRLSRRPAGAVLHGGRAGQSAGEGAEAVHPGPLPRAARSGAPADLR